MNFEAAAKMIIGECCHFVNVETYQAQLVAAKNALRAAYNIGHKDGCNQAASMVDECLVADPSLIKLGNAIRSLYSDQH